MCEHKQISKTKNTKQGTTIIGMAGLLGNQGKKSRSHTSHVKGLINVYKVEVDTTDKLTDGPYQLIIAVAFRNLVNKIQISQKYKPSEVLWYS